MKAAFVTACDSSNWRLWQCWSGTLLHFECSNRAATTLTNLSRFEIVELTGVPDCNLPTCGFFVDHVLIDEDSFSQPITYVWSLTVSLVAPKNHGCLPIKLSKKLGGSQWQGNDWSLTAAESTALPAACSAKRQGLALRVLWPGISWTSAGALIWACKCFYLASSGRFCVEFFARNLLQYTWGLSHRQIGTPLDGYVANFHISGLMCRLLGLMDEGTPRYTNKRGENGMSCKVKRTAATCCKQ